MGLVLMWLDSVLVDIQSVKNLVVFFIDADEVVGVLLDEIASQKFNKLEPGEDVSGFIPDGDMFSIGGDAAAEVSVFFSDLQFHLLTAGIMLIIRGRNHAGFTGPFFRELLQ